MPTTFVLQVDIFVFFYYMIYVMLITLVKKKHSKVLPSQKIVLYLYYNWNNRYLTYWEL